MTALLDRIDLDLRKSYRLPGAVPDCSLEAGKTALLIIDMQYLDAHRDGEYGKRAREHGIEDRVEWFFQRLEQQTGPAAASNLLFATRPTRLSIAQLSAR